MCSTRGETDRALLRHELPTCAKALVLLVAVVVDRFQFFLSSPTPSAAETPTALCQPRHLFLELLLLLQWHSNGSQSQAALKFAELILYQNGHSHKVTTELSGIN